MTEAGSSSTGADRVRVAALQCPGVADIPSPVQVDDEHVEIHVVAHYGQPLRELADRIGEAVRALLHGQSVGVTVDDVLLPGETIEAP